jgi:AraC-like DNA-binding protein
MLPTRRYPVSHPLLKRLIKYFWVLESQSPLEANYKLLPVSNIAFIFNYSSSITYITEGRNEIISKGFHFHGIRDRYYVINTTGDVNVLGISFFKEGLYPLLKSPLSEYANNIIELDWIVKGFTSIEEKVNMAKSVPERLNIIENELLKLIDVELLPAKEIYRLFQAFSTSPENGSISLFCERYGINQRKLERIFNKYIGISPKLFIRINRLQGVINEMVKNKDSDLTLVAYENNYYDQTHFIKDFKSFTGSTPTQFLNQNASVKQVIKYL